jgi:hypothetical protein
MVDGSGTNDGNSQTTNNLENGSAAPEVAAAAQTNREQKESQQDPHYAEHKMRPLKAVGGGILATVNWIDTKGPFITALATVGIAVLTAYYVHYSRTANIINQKSANAAANAAVTAQNTLTQSIEAFRTDERAWVVVDQIALLESHPPHSTFPWSFKYGVYAKNVGKTIALDVRIHIDSFFGFGQLNKQGIEMTQGRTWGGWKGKDLAPDKAGPSSLAPGERSLFPIVAGGEAPRSGWVETEVGHIDYVDAFGAKHWKNFCFTVVDEKGTLTHCEGGGNDEDTNDEPAP